MKNVFDALSQKDKDLMSESDGRFFIDYKTKQIYCADVGEFIEFLDSREVMYNQDDAEIEVNQLTEKQIYVLQAVQAESDAEDMTEFLKDLYEKFTDQKIYTSNEYNDLYTQKNQLEKTLNAIKALL